MRPAGVGGAGLRARAKNSYADSVRRNDPPKWTPRTNPRKGLLACENPSERKNQDFSYLRRRRCCGGGAKSRWLVLRVKSNRLETRKRGKCEVI